LAQIRFCKPGPGIGNIRRSDFSCIVDVCIYIYREVKHPLPNLPCLCASLRRASRAVTQLYEEALRPVGLTTSQFTILQALSLAGELNQGELGRALAMDSTTLTRTLAIMIRNGWIAKRRGKDRREWRLSLAKAGRSRFEAALPHWESAQSELRMKLGDRWDVLMNLTNDLTNAVSE
jgi:DNA-binding MarR family transcriptional regulator